MKCTSQEPSFIELSRIMALIYSSTTPQFSTWKNASLGLYRMAQAQISKRKKNVGVLRGEYSNIQRCFQNI
jgi:hypothetical protein